jgi:LIVCS family branched-chain amino acid:cation transporter
MSYLKTVLVAGFAMFSMFFGSANLVFPIMLGKTCSYDYILAVIGWLLTATIIPFLGLLGIIKCQGDQKKYFNKIGKHPTFLLSILVMLLMGPLGVIPRCINVSFGGFAVLFPNMQPWFFNLFFCIAILSLVWQKNKVVEILGIYITPFKFGGIFFLILVSLIYAPESSNAQICANYNFDNFLLGAKLGYQTMDLIAAILFGGTIIGYLKQKSDNREIIFKLGVYSSILGGILLGLIYISFVILGSKYSGFMPQETLPEQMFAIISQQAIGFMGLPIVNFTIAVSCLATSVILTTIWVDFLESDIFKNSFSRKNINLFSIILIFVMSLLGFNQISIFLGAILDWIYPLLIVYAVYKVFSNARTT